MKIRTYEKAQYNQRMILFVVKSFVNVQYI